MQKLQIQQHKLKMNKGEVFFRRIGHPETAKYNLIILHGLQNSGSFFWQDFLQKFEYDYDFSLTIPDIPGFGKNREINYEEFSFFLEEFLEKTQISNPVFISHSFGNIWLLEYFQYKKTDSLKIFLNPPFFINQDKIKLFFIQLCNKILLFFKPLFWSKKINKMLKLNLKIHIFHNQIGLKMFIKSCQKYNINSLKNLKTPTLLMTGEKDKFVSLDSVRKGRKLIANNIFIISNGDHDPFLHSDNVQELYLNTKSFLNNFK